MAKQSFFNRLKSLFGISVQKKDRSYQIAPAEAFPPEDKDSARKSKKIHLTPEIQRLWDLWINETYDTAESFKNRLERYKDLEFAYYNDGIFSTAVDLYADETTQADAQSDIIGVYAKNTKVEKYIKEFFENIGITDNLIKSVAFDVSLYSDAFFIHTIKPGEGITEVTPLEPKIIKDRLEFNAAKYQEHLNQRRGGLYNYLNTLDFQKELAKVLDTDESLDISQMYKSYLFGYQVGDYYTAPWSITHFRRFSTNSEFHPFGRPIMINAIAPFRKLQASKNLMAILRTQKFPLRLMKVLGGEALSGPVKKFEHLEEVRSDFYDLGSEMSNKDEFTSQTDLWMMDGLLDIDIHDSNINLNDIADIELLQDNLIISTKIPKGYLITDRGSFGQSGQSLLQQSKVFGRGVYTIQSAILEGLTELVRLQFVITGDFDYDEEFELSMNFPVQEQSSDQLRMKGDTLRLAKDIIDNISQLIGLERDEALPPDVVKQVLAKYSFLDSEEINTWVDDSLASLESPPEDQPGSNGAFFDSTERRKRIMEKVNSRLYEDTIRSAYFKSKKSLNLEEGIMNEKHFKLSGFVSSRQKDYFEFIKANINSSDSRSLKEATVKI